MNKLKKTISFFTPRKILAILFFAYIFYVGIAAVPDFIENLAYAVDEEVPVEEFIETIDEQFSDDMLSDKLSVPLLQNNGTYININGLMARLLNQKTLNSRILLSNGHLHYCTGEYSDEVIASGANNIANFCNSHIQSGGNFLFVVAPDQIYDSEKLLPYGYDDYAVRNAERFVACLEENGVPVLDLRQEMINQGIDMDEAFYITDHHWTTQTGFWAYGEIMKKLQSMGVISELDKFYTDKSSFNFDTYEDSFLGSSGKRTGKYYAGVDDFCIVYPDFDTDITLTVPHQNIEASGTYTEVSLRYPFETLVSDLETKNYFRANPYGFYGRGDTALTNWRNTGAVEDQKLLLIGNSFGNVPFSFLPLYFTSCDEMDMRHYNLSFPSYYSEYQPDTVIMLVNSAELSSIFITHPYLNQ